jgi:hypothetical protein
MYHISQIQEREGSDYYRDVWMVLTDHHTKTHDKMNELAIFNGTKCCWHDKEDPSKGLSHFFTGFGRMVEFADFNKGGAGPSYAVKLMEGQF